MFFGAQSKAVAGDVTDNSVFLFVFVFCILLILNLLFCVFSSSVRGSSGE